MVFFFDNIYFVIFNIHAMLFLYDLIYSNENDLRAPIVRTKWVEINAIERPKSGTNRSKQKKRT